MFELGVVKRHIVRADRAAVADLVQHGASTVHEAMGRVGLMATYMRPIYAGARVSGTAVTVLLQPGDNWRCMWPPSRYSPATSSSRPARRPTPTASSATCWPRRSAPAVRSAWSSTAAGRDVRDLTEMGFPVWSRAISSKGTVKATLAR